MEGLRIVSTTIYKGEGQGRGCATIELGVHLIPKDRYVLMALEYIYVQAEDAGKLPPEATEGEVLDLT